jgi:NTE family protein
MIYKKTWLTSFFVFLLFIGSCSIAIGKPDDEGLKKKRPTVGLVLSGGGSKGFAYIGLFKVLQEVDLRVDYIGGTSIGSIMGGLYALGYSPEYIEKIIRSQDWEALITDKIPRKYIAYEEKQFVENTVVSLAIKDRKIGMKRSLFEGQQINLMLNRYFSPAWDIKDFNKLKTPFLCVGTNLFNGDAEVLHHGYLPMAVRSSMSIPGYFSPTHFNGFYLVDGGLVDNYPAVPLKKLGAEYLIGGDIQSSEKDSISQLSSITDVLAQIIFFHGRAANEKAAKIIDLNIKYHVKGGDMDFVNYDSIIAYGERVARQHYDELKQLADSLNAIEYRPVKTYDTQPLDSFNIRDVIYQGRGKMSMIYLNNYFEAFENRKVAIDDIEEVITRVYGTGFFQYVFYEVRPVGNGQGDLLIKMEEAPPGNLSASVHYDSDYNGSFKVGSVFRNVLGHRSKLFTEFTLGKFPRLWALYEISNGAKPGFGAEIDLYSFKFDVYNKSKKINTYGFANYKLSLFVSSVLENLYSFRTGITVENFKLSQDIAIDSSLNEFDRFNSYGNVFIQFKADTRDKSVFPTSGFQAELMAMYATTLSKGWVDNVFSNSFVFYAKYKHSLSLSKRFVLRPGFFVGGTLKQDIPPVQHWFGVGGLNEINYVSNFVPFAGVSFVQKYGFYSGIGRLQLQYNVYKKIYLTFRSDFGSTEDHFDDLILPENLMFGYGVTTSYNSFIGPVSFSVMGSNLNPGATFFVNIGFSF